MKEQLKQFCLLACASETYANPPLLADQRASRKLATSKQKEFCLLQFAKTESAITVERAFRINFDCQSTTDNNILKWYRSLSWHYFQDDDRYNSCQVIYSQFGLAIHQKDHQARRRFVEWAPNEIAVFSDFHKRILFSDEAHFWLNGYVNKQNCRIWSEANPQVYTETPLHPEKLTVWCALWAGGIIGPYFFKKMKATTLQSMVISIEP
ncbi:DUF4817 domain-containing protein [Trichonephila clavipes]|nr:DUF4817 domain-containing protein [Trichonephila clavipes]